MADTARKSKFWLITVFVVIVAFGVLYSWQSIYAQSQNSQIPVETPPPGAMDASGMAGMGAAAGGTGSSGSSAPSTTGIVTEPAIGFGQLVHSGAKVISKKNWDGRVFTSLKFKHKTLDGRVLTVVLPAEYKAEQRTKTGWETLFAVYAMDVEIAQDAAAKNAAPDVSAFLGRLMAELRGQAGNRTAPEIISSAMEKAKTYLPAMGMGNVDMPIMLPGMP